MSVWGNKICCCVSPRKLWRRLRAALDPARALRELSEELETAAPEAGGEPGLDLQSIEHALHQHGFDMEDLAQMAGDLGDHIIDDLPEVPPEPPVDFIVTGDELVMSDGSAVGTVLTRSGRHEVYKLRKDGVALDIDSWFRRTFGVRRCYLINDHKAVIGAVRINTFATDVVPERPLLPVSRSTRGPLHPVDTRVRVAAFFVWDL